LRKETRRSSSPTLIRPRFVDPPGNTQVARSAGDHHQIHAESPSHPPLWSGSPSLARSSRSTPPHGHAERSGQLAPCWWQAREPDHRLDFHPIRPGRSRSPSNRPLLDSIRIGLDESERSQTVAPDRRGSVASARYNIHAAESEPD